MKPSFTHGWKRLFVIVFVVHLLLSCVMLVVALAAAVGAHEGEPVPGEAAATTLMNLVSWPIVLARMVLPESMAPGFGLLELLVNSLVWAAAVVGVVVLWRRWRSRTLDDGAYPTSRAP